MVLETQRLFLRQMTEADYDALHAVLSDPDVMRHYPHPFDESQIHAWISRNIERYRVFGFGLWAVCLKNTGEMIGDCGLSMQIIHGQIRPEIGYHIRRDQQRKGYAKEAACAVRDWAFENTPFSEICSCMKYSNEASSRTAMSYGCHQVDEYRDEVNGITKVFAISRDEWRALTNATPSSGPGPAQECREPVMRKDIRRIDVSNREVINAFIRDQWFTLQMVVHGEAFDLGSADGFFAASEGRMLGLVTFRIQSGILEILSLDSVEENRGVGTALLNESIAEARRHGCSYVTLVTTNDNTRALRFYQKRGFDLFRLSRNALDASRKLKPEIPLSGFDGIPLRHEIELRLML